MQWGRIADVNYNRLNESLKLLEDFIRFSLENKLLLTAVRAIRTQFLRVKKRISMSDVIQARASRSDLGRSPAFDRSARRTSDDIVIANLARVKESARILEEILKTKDVRASAFMKEIRFRLYDLESALYAAMKRCFDPSLHVIIDDHYFMPSRLEQDVKTMVRGGVTMVQLRINDLSDRMFLRYANKIMGVLEGSRVVFIVNNRIDIARACGAHGVHIGQRDLPVRAARDLIGDQGIIGVSARSITQARRAEHDGADYLGVGAVCPTRTKHDARVIGLAGLRGICNAVSIPVIGVGGITNRNYRSVLRAGASGIAVSSYLYQGSLKRNIGSLTGKHS
ncbi:thiamine phosphate synthase [candidate division WOR-3 bacterium]|nr:thiamine phosphate synthase [candidate division WOR-3 bacterium]